MTQWLSFGLVISERAKQSKPERWRETLRREAGNTGYVHETIPREYSLCKSVTSTNIRVCRYMYNWQCALRQIEIWLCLHQRRIFLALTPINFLLSFFLRDKSYDRLIIVLK